MKKELLLAAILGAAGANGSATMAEVRKMKLAMNDALRADGHTFSVRESIRQKALCVDGSVTASLRTVSPTPFPTTASPVAAPTSAPEPTQAPTDPEVDPVTEAPTTTSDVDPDPERRMLESVTFDCKNVDFLSFIGFGELNMGNEEDVDPSESADIWGWRSPETGKEYTILTMYHGTAFIDSTDGENPCVIAKMQTNRRPQVWHDVKVYDNTAYFVKDDRLNDEATPGSGHTFGGQVFDLLRLDNLTCPEDPLKAPFEQEDYAWNFHGSSHNLVINTETGYLYSVGSEYCAGGMVVIDVKTDRLRPQFVGCIDQDGYTHDAQCVTYRGPDEEFLFSEICFAFNEDTVTIWDVSDKEAPEMLSSVSYPGAAYIHQGWLTDDMATLLVDDELNEWCSETPDVHPFCSNDYVELDNITKTSTIFFDVSDLRNPVQLPTYYHAQDSIDHNLYIWGAVHRYGWGGNERLTSVPNPKYAFLHNYEAGLRILDISDVSNAVEWGYFDIHPEPKTGPMQFSGAWSGYFHPSGVYAVSSIDRGVFFLQPNVDFVQAAAVQDIPNPLDDIIGTDSIVGGVIAVGAIVIGSLLLYTVVVERRKGLALVAKEEAALKAKEEAEAAVKEA